MQKLLAALLFAASITANAAHTPSNKPEEVKAISQVVTDFAAAIKSKDTMALGALLLNSNILFSSPASDEQIKYLRTHLDPTADGVRAGGYHDFARFLREEKKSVEEKFYNIRITQDSNLAWVVTDYEFLVDDKVENDGVEVWQLVKREGKWKIYSVTWSANFKPEPAK